MKIGRAIGIMAVAVLALAWPAAAQVPPGVGEGWKGEFDHAASHVTQLAEAIPADKFGWRPGPGVRSIAEVCMHPRSAITSCSARRAPNRWRI